MDASEIAKCQKKGGSFADFVLAEGDSNSRFAPVLILLLINIPICGTLLYFTRLCDKVYQHGRRERRRAILTAAVDEHSRVYNSVELLRAEKARLRNASNAEDSPSRRGNNNHHTSRLSHRSSSSSTLAPDNNTYRQDCLETKLARQEHRLSYLERYITYYHTAPLGERLAEFLSRRPPPGSTGPRCLAVLVASLLISLSIAPIALAPLAIAANAYCGPDMPSRDEPTVTFWILYAILDVAPAVTAWYGVWIAILNRGAETTRAFVGYVAQDIEKDADADAGGAASDGEEAGGEAGREQVVFWPSSRFAKTAWPGSLNGAPMDHNDPRQAFCWGGSV